LPQGGLPEAKDADEKKREKSDGTTAKGGFYKTVKETKE
jgi:hypothetical protein